MDQDSVELELELVEPLSASVCGRLLLEGVEARELGCAGLLLPTQSEVSRDRIQLLVGPLSIDARRFDLAMRRLPPAIGAAKLLVAEYCIHNLIEALTRLATHRETPSLKPWHGRLYDRSILIQPDGSLTIIGGGFPGLTEFLLPPPATPGAGQHLMAPEVLREEPLNARADVYSLGALLYGLVAETAYRAQLSELELRAAAFSGRPADLPVALEDVPPDLLELIAWTLSPEESARCPDLNTLGSELELIMKSAGLHRLAPRDFAKLVLPPRTNAVDHGLAAFGEIAVDSALDRPLPILRRRDSSEPGAAQIVISNASPASGPPEHRPSSSVLALERARGPRARRVSVVEVDRRTGSNPGTIVPSSRTVELPPLELARLRDLSVGEIASDTDRSEVPLPVAAFAESLATEDLGASNTGDLSSYETESLSLPWLLIAAGFSIGVLVLLFFGR